MSSVFSHADVLFADWRASESYLGWQTICPHLLSPDAVCEPLFEPRRFRSPSPTPTMSSEDDPVSAPAASVAKTGTEPIAVPNPAASDQTAKKQSDSQTDNNGSADSRSGTMFWHSQKLSDEPLTSDAAAGSAPTPSSAGTQASNSSHRGGSRPSRFSKARSTSTESSLSLSGMTTLGSMYNQDGFPNYPVSSEEDLREAAANAQMPMDDAAIAKQLALTDEAVRHINGTASVVQARNFGDMMMPPTPGNAYELPRSMAAFVHRQPADATGVPNDRGLTTGRSFVSSGSSTSSEESEHLASVQWVKSVSQPSPSYANQYPFFYGAKPPGQASSPKMPPPLSTGAHRGVTSPRRNGGSVPPGPGSGPDTPNAIPAPHSGSTPNALSGVFDGDNDDDDAQTVGGANNREGSPSSSSASGLDLLSHAAAHHERSRNNSYSKRKAGADAVAQWRESGIPSGSRLSDGSPPEGQARDGHVEPPKKRRRSELQLEQPHSLQAGSDGADDDGGSDFESASASDSEYHGAKGRKSGTRGNKGKQKMRVRATLPAAGTPPPKGGAKKGGSKGARRLSESTDKPSFSNGVQCEYVNPLPPYQRCPDVFTRKYDIPRHMARHARREGDLVAEGKLAEDKALLWRTIRDKPRIRCKTCGEYFTRQDALKRHQTKQHHH